MPGPEDKDQICIFILSQWETQSYIAKALRLELQISKLRLTFKWNMRQIQNSLANHSTNQSKQNKTP